MNGINTLSLDGSFYSRESSPNSTRSVLNAEVLLTKSEEIKEYSSDTMFSFAEEEVFIQCCIQTNHWERQGKAIYVMQYNHTFSSSSQTSIT